MEEETKEFLRKYHRLENRAAVNSRLKQALQHVIDGKSGNFRQAYRRLFGRQPPRDLGFICDWESDSDMSSSEEEVQGCEEE